MVTKRLQIAIYILAICACSVLTGCVLLNAPTTSLLDYDTELFSVLMGDGVGGNKDAKDALRLCSPILYKLVRGSSEDWNGELCAPIDSLMGYYYENGVLPREPYEGVGDYCTSMDAPLLALTAEYAYERGLGEKYHQYMLDLIPYLTKDTQHGGYVLKLNENEWWPLEYAWKTVTEDDAWFVINGSLFGMLCTEMLKQVTGDKGLEELSGKALAAYKAKADKFYYDDGVWCWYALNFLDGNRIVNRPEKLLIEIKSLRGLYQLTGEKFYHQEAEKRTKMLSNLYPAYICEGENGKEVRFLRAGAPHPYDIDIYRTHLQIIDKNGAVIAESECSDRSPSGAYMCFSVPDSATGYRWLCGGDDYFLLESELKPVLPDEINLPERQGTWSGSNDAVSVENGTVTIDPDASETPKAWIYFSFDEPACLYSPESYLIVEINNASSETFAVTPVIYDSNGTTMGRTSTPCPPGESYQILHFAGFKDHDCPLESVDMVGFGLITNQMETPKAKVQLGPVYVTTNTAQVVEFLAQRNFTDFWICEE